MKVINREWDLIAAENGNSITNALDKDKVLILSYKGHYK